MARRYSYSTCLSFGTDGEADYCEIDVTVSFAVVWGEPETGPTYASGGTPATGDLVEDVQVVEIDGRPVVVGDAVTKADILAKFATGEFDDDLLAHAGEVDWADADWAADLRRDDQQVQP